MPVNTRSSAQTTRTSSTRQSTGRTPRVTHNIGSTPRVTSSRRVSTEVPVIETQVSNASGDDTSSLVHNSIPMPRPNGRLCDTFSGSDPLVKINIWLGLFDVVTTGYTDEEKFIALCRHITADAMTWAVMDIAPIRQTLKWSDIKARMQQRFGRAVHNHLMEAVDRDLNPNETIESYFNEKRRLMALAGQDDENQVALLTRGLTNISMKKHIAAQMPETPQVWLKIALAIETIHNSAPNSFKGKRSDSHSHHNEKDSSHVDKAGQHKKWIDFSKPPTTPCPHCRKPGPQGLHWKRDCPLLTQQQSTDSSSNFEIPEQTSTSGAHSTQTVDPLNFVHFDVLVDGKPLRPFLDSGSTITAMSRSAAERLKLKWKPEDAIPLKHIDGITRTLGALNANIQIAGKTFRFPIQILDRFAHDMLLGLDIAHAAGLVVDFGKQVISRSFALQPIGSANHFSQTRVVNSFNKPTNRTAVSANAMGDNSHTHNGQTVTQIPSEASPISLSTSGSSTESRPQLKSESQLTNRVVNELIHSSLTAHIEVNRFFELQHEIRAYHLRKPLIINGLIHVHFNGTDHLVIPPSLLDPILSHFHENERHPEFEQTLETIGSRFWFPNKEHTIARVISSCHTCRANRPQTVSSTPPLKSVSSPERLIRFWDNDGNFVGRTVKGSDAKFCRTVINRRSHEIKPLSSRFFHFRRKPDIPRHSVPETGGQATAKSQVSHKRQALNSGDGHHSSNFIHRIDSTQQSFFKDDTTRKRISIQQTCVANRKTCSSTRRKRSPMKCKPPDSASWTSVAEDEPPGSEPTDGSTRDRVLSSTDCQTF